MMQQTPRILTKSIQITEYFFAIIVLASVFISLFFTISSLLTLNWTENKVFYEIIYRILLLVIGLELARLLITHNIQSVIELIAFVIARKTLKPDVTSLDILFIVISFFLLIVSGVLSKINIKPNTKKFYGNTE